jgi:FKBP-type peptidyl-prolyl cis-trans isomerase
MKSFVKVRVTKTILIILLSFLGGTSLFAQGLDLENTESRTGYSIGVNIGLNLASQGILGDDVDNAALMQGIRDAIDDSIQMSDEEIIAALEQYSVLMEQRAQEQLAGMAEEGESFLNDNAMQPGGVTTSRLAVSSA